jgi:hypothetical protein
LVAQAQGSHFKTYVWNKNSSSIWNISRLCPQEDQNPQMTDYAGTSFTNIIYTKSASSPSSKICRVIYAFVHALSVNEGPSFSSQSSQLPKNLYHSAFLACPDGVSRGSIPVLSTVEGFDIPFFSVIRRMFSVSAPHQLPILKGAYTESFSISPKMVQNLSCSPSHWSIKAA